MWVQSCCFSFQDISVLELQKVLLGKDLFIHPRETQGTKLGFQSAPEWFFRLPRWAADAVGL